WGHGPRADSCDSAAQAEALDERAVAGDVDVLEVAEEATALTDEQQQATTGVVVVLVRLEVLREVLDALRQERDLDLGGTGVARVRGVLVDDRLLDVCVQSHRAAPLPLAARCLSLLLRRS